MQGAGGCLEIGWSRGRACAGRIGCKVDAQGRNLTLQDGFTLRDEEDNRSGRYRRAKLRLRNANFANFVGKTLFFNVQVRQGMRKRRGLSEQQDQGK